MKLGVIYNILSIQTDNIQVGKLPVIKWLDIYITSMADKLFSIFHHHHLEDNSKIIISLLLNLFGIGMLKTEKLVGIPARLLSLMQIILSPDISIKLILLLEENVKEETLASNKVGLSSKLKK